MLGILAFGFLSDNVLRRKMYLTIAFVTTCQIVYILISFLLDEQIAQEESIQEMFALIIGSIFGANNFLYEFLLPLKLVRKP